MTTTLLRGDCRDILPTMPADSFDCGMSAPRRTNTRADMSTGRFAIAYICSDGIRGPVEGTKVFDSEGAAARAAAMLHFAKPHINYGVIDLDAKAAEARR